MTIGIDIRLLGNQRQSGIKEYTERLLEHLIPLAADHTIKLFYSSRSVPLSDYSWLKSKNVQLYSFNIPNNLLFLSGRLTGRPQIDQMMGGVDLFFSPHFFLAPLSKKVKRVTTFHDLSYLILPEFFSFRQNIWHRIQMRPKKQAQLSDKIIAVSESTKNDLAQRYDIDPASISVIYPGVKLEKPSPEKIQEFKDRHQLSRYVLALSTLEPRKNITSTIRAFELLKSNPAFDDYELLIVGSRGWKYQSVLSMIQDSSLAKQIRYIGAVSDSDKPLYYSGASLFVYPSFFEGFGFPVLEAMSCGTPVITSHNSSLPEVAGDAALLVDPYNCADLGKAMETLLTDATLKDTLIKRGFERSTSFSWEKTAAETLKLFESTAL
ncbi:glycosyltransferase family 4 protein [Candidatus Parcubacteria bacterium]|nr:glycosyltransferase family 4 protein [Candidatus Parcubacteria bacterium]